MITISLQSVYYALGIASILCSAAFKLGYEIGKIHQENIKFLSQKNKDFLQIKETIMLKAK